LSLVYATQRLDVRSWTSDPADVDRIFDICSRWEVARWLGAEPRPLADRAEAAAAAQRWAGFGAHDDRCGCWAVEAFRPAAADRGE
jgi:RimJ/RimL family protein N-acetyltransferase